MIAVIFEVWPASGRTQDYLDLAAALRDDLAASDGFLSVERFRSLGEPGKLLLLSFWRDEAAVRAWRGRSAHRATQARGRLGMPRATPHVDVRVRRRHLGGRGVGSSGSPPTPVPARVSADVAERKHLIQAADALPEFGR